jgi:ketosteroid isomerase-like protein
MTTADVRAIAQLNKEVVLRAIDAIKTFDVDTFLDAFHAEVTIHEPEYLPYAGVYHGADGFHRLFTEAVKLVDVSSLDVVSATVDEERAVLLMTAELISTRERVHITEHWVLAEGKVVDVRVFWFDLPR